MLTVADGKTTVWAEIPLNELAFGNAMDCDFTLRLYRILRLKVKELKLHHIYDKLIKDAMEVLVETELNGMALDVGYLNELDEKLVSCVEETKAELMAASPFGEEFNPKSSDDIIEILFSDEGFGLMPIKFNERSKKPCVDAKDLASMLYEIRQAL